MASRLRACERLELESNRVRARLPHITDRLTLGTSGLSVSPFCLGMVRTPQTVHAAFDAGINFFFITADMHWPMYEHTRRGIQQLIASRPSVRDDIVVAVVSYPTQPEFCYAPFLEVLDEVRGLGRIDVAVMGGVYANDFVTRLDIYRGHQRDGHAGVRAIGATFHDRLAARSALALNAVEIAFARYNPSHPGAREDLFPFRPAGGPTHLFNFNSTVGAVGVDAWAGLGLGPGYWQPKQTDYYRFALTRPEVDGLLCSPATPDQIDQLAAALEEGPLEEEEAHYLINLAALAEGRVSLDRAEP